jgi:predicted PurR-regulated permease PerM
MLVVVILANGLLQNIVQPFAMGSALDLNPLVVLVLTIGAGCVFGMIGLVLAAPIASAAVHISRDLARARASAAAEALEGRVSAELPPETPTVSA